MTDSSIPSSSLSTPTPTSSSSPASPSVFRPRRSEDWNKFRPVIEQLYRDDQLKLKDVKRIMERQHNFVASEKQYKDRLAAWNIRKNIKAKEVNIMIRKQQKRAAKGKQTVFRVAGQKVDTKRIARFVRRYGTNWDNNEPRPVEPHRDSPDPCMSTGPVSPGVAVNVGTATPSDMSYYTPEPDERATTLSPHPDNHTHSFDNLDSIPDSPLDETKSLPITLSPSASTNDTPKPIETISPISDDPWAALTNFQNRLLELGEKLDHATAGLYPPDEPNQQHQH
ncbi:Clr5 domain-containing protein [Aspergillus varians]